MSLDENIIKPRSLARYVVSKYPTYCGFSAPLYLYMKIVMKMFWVDIDIQHLSDDSVLTFCTTYMIYNG